MYSASFRPDVHPSPRQESDIFHIEFNTGTIYIIEETYSDRPRKCKISLFASDEQSCTTPCSNSPSNYQTIEPLAILHHGTIGTHILHPVHTLHHSPGPDAEILPTGREERHPRLGRQVGRVQEEAIFIPQLDLEGARRRVPAGEGSLSPLRQLCVSMG